MSERIKELVKKSGIGIADFGEDIVEGRYSVTASVNALEKFAELIVKESINIPLKSMVSIANQTLNKYVDNLDESSKKEFFQLISEDAKTLQEKFETIRESAINKLNVILENEEEFELRTKLSETIDRLKNEKFDQLNFLKLKSLEESI